MESTAQLSRRRQMPGGGPAFMMAILIAGLGLIGVPAAAADENTAVPAAAAEAPAAAAPETQAKTEEAKAEEAKPEEAQASRGKPRVSPYALYRKRQAEAARAGNTGDKTPKKKKTSGKPAGQVSLPK